MDSKIEQIAAGYLQLIPLLFTRLDKPAEPEDAWKMPQELTHLQYHILEEMFHHKEGSSMTQLAKNIRISKQQLTPLITKLEEKNYVSKTADSQDKRLVRLLLTDKGRATVSRRWEIFHMHLCQQLEHLDEEDLADLDYAIAKMTRIVRRLDKELPDN